MFQGFHGAGDYFYDKFIFMYNNCNPDFAFYYQSFKETLEFQFKYT